MPGRSRAATVLERPSTSSGPSSSKFMEKPTFDKRVSRDDLALALKGYGKGNLKAYHVPIRGKLPSPETSPRSESPTRFTMVRTSTPESMGEPGGMGVIAIGMALGSPTHPPYQGAAPSTWHSQQQQSPPPQPQQQAQAPMPSQPQIQRQNSATVAAKETPAAAAQHDEASAKPRARKWSIFGRSKSKRGRTTDVPAQRPADPEQRASGGTQHHGQTEQDSKKTPKHKPIVIRSQTEPLKIEQLESHELKSPLEAKELGSKASMKSTRGESRSRRAEKEAPTPVPPVPMLSGPFLDVEIPSIKMERYSVMFGNVLQQPQRQRQQSQPQPASSLLARRQATLDRLKTIGDEMAQEEAGGLPQPRKINASQTRDSATFSLFPSTPGAASRSTTPQKLSPRSRSNTSPALLPSPSKETFNGPMPSKQPHKEASKARPRTASRDKAAHRDMPSPPGPRGNHLVSKFSKQASPFQADKSSLVLESPEQSDEDRAEVHIKEKLRPEVVEPTWEMITPPPSTASSSTPSVSKKQSPPPSAASSEQTPANRNSQDEAAEALMHAVEISIARQISVSHQQRKMLRPLQSHPSLRNQNGSQRNSPAGKSDRLGEVSIATPVLIETKTATPTLVHPEQNNDSSKMAGHVYRKSERVILEGP